MWNGSGIGKFLGVGWAILVPWEVLWDRKTSIVGPAIPYLSCSSLNSLSYCSMLSAINLIFLLCGLAIVVLFLQLLCTTFGCECLTEK